MKEKKMGDEIFVAGGTGLVGANLTHRLVKIGKKVVSSKHKNRNPIFNNCLFYNFTDYNDCIEATKNKDAVVICAGEFHGVKKDNKKVDSLLNNLKINIGLIEASAENNVKTVIILSTSAVYQNAVYKIREDQINLNSPPFRNFYGIGWTFRYIEQICRYYADNYGIRIIIFRPTNIYGPHDNFNDERSHVIPALIKRALRGESPIIAWGNPNVVRDFIFVEDVVDDIIEAIDNETIPSCEPINICNGNPMTILNAAEIIVEKCGMKNQIEFDIHKPSSIPYRALNNEKYKVYFGNKKRTNFGDGIEATIDWYRNFHIKKV